MLSCNCKVEKGCCTLNDGGQLPPGEYCQLDRDSGPTVQQMGGLKKTLDKANEGKL